MNFVSSGFFFFLVTVWALFNTLPARLRLPFLLAASYLFYATWSVPFLAVILITTNVDYWLSHRIQRSENRNTKIGLLWLGIGINLAILGLFKYANFTLDTAHGLAAYLGYTLALPKAVSLILPLGISFYTFEAISYLVDVYRGKPAARNWLDYNFYIMFFPHLISGPIIRFGELWSQYRQALQPPELPRLAKACELILLGYVFKVFIADPMAGLAAPVFAHPHGQSVLDIYIGALAFTVQIYFDFMGYTHIARGASLLFNIELPLNFNHPYLATNISNFWERWHISLSRWIRDYLYFPLGGSRGSQLRTVGNLVLVMLLAGAWHGAGWTYILWGGYHGVLLALYHLYKALAKRGGLISTAWQCLPVYRVFSIGLTFMAVVAGWIIFRASNLTVAGALLTQYSNVPGFFAQIVHQLVSGHLTKLMSLLGLLLLCFSGPWVVRNLENVYRSQPFWVKVQLACILAFLCWIATAQGSVPFIYFQF